MNTSSGAEWAYFMDAFGDTPAFLFSWVSTLVLKPSQMAIICLSFAQCKSNEKFTDGLMICLNVNVNVDQLCVPNC